MLPVRLPVDCPPKESRRVRNSVSTDDLVLIERNLFPPAIAEMKKVRPDQWFRDRWSPIAASRPKSSQAMAVSVFGTLDNLQPSSRDAVFDALAEAAGVTRGGPWSLELEHEVPREILC
jgi:hypothetical protein